MARLPVIAAAVLAIAASAPLICTTTTPASAQGWQDRDGDVGRDLRDLLRDRIRTRQDLRDLVDALEERQERRERMRYSGRGDEDEDGYRGGMHERMGYGRDRDDEDGGYCRGRLRERLAERIAERRRGYERRGLEEGECFFLTRSLRDEDGDVFVLIRRRVCPE
jgi:hypothetical protein